MPITKVKNEPQVAPYLRVEIQGQNNVNAVEVRNGDQVLWVNTYSKHCTLKFTESPFADQSTQHRVRAGEYTLSPPIRGPVNSSYRYKVDCGEDERPDLGEPVIIITG